MRTTIDLPDDLHRQATSIARDNHQTLSQAVVALMRRGLGQDRSATVRTDERTGRVVLHVGRPVTEQDVRSLDDDE
ncbi:MAG: hypothetical protein LBU50_04395 [Cellulomonas sp.]|nr:hypothetical protein [Cellulomonas sp.]